MKYDRGWNLEKGRWPPETFSAEEIPEELNRLDLSEDETKKPSKQTDDPDVQRRLDAVEVFYVSFNLASIPGTEN